MANTKAIKFSNNGYTYLPVTNSDIVQYSNQGISVTSAIQTLAASSQDTFIDGNESSAILHIKSVDETTVNKSYTFTGSAAGEGKSAVTVSYANNTITISATYTNTDTKVTSATNHYTPSGTDTNATYVNGNLTQSTDSVPLTHGSSLVITGVKFKKDSKGHVTELSYSLGKLPTDSDTKNTAGSSNDANKLFLVGAKSQASSAQTFSNSAVYTWGGTTYSTTFKGDLLGTINTATTATTQSTSDDSTKVATTAFVHDVVDGALTNLSGALKYKGVVTKNEDLPTAAASTVGNVYVVKTAGNYTIDHNADGTATSQALEAGDYIIGTYIGTTYTWIPVNGENQVTLGTKTLPADGTEKTLVTVDGIAVPFLHGSPSGGTALTATASGSGTATEVTDSSYIPVVTGISVTQSNGHVTGVGVTTKGLKISYTDTNTSQVKVASKNSKTVYTYISPDGNGGTGHVLQLAEGDNVSLAADTTNNKITISSSDTNTALAKIGAKSIANVPLYVGPNATNSAAGTGGNTMTFIQGTNITLTPDTTNNKLTIAHTSPSGATTKSSALYKIATDSQGHVTSATAASFGAAPTGLKYVTSTTDVEDFTLSGITFETTTVDLAKVFTPTVS